MTDQDTDRLREFYREEETFPSVIAMEARLHEAVVIAEMDDGKILGVIRAFATTPPQIMQPLYYHCTFISKNNRDGSILRKLIRRSVEILEEYAVVKDYPCVGVLMELFNAAFYEKPKTWRRKGVWPGLPFHYIGKSIRGNDLRVYYFPDAYLKEVGELHG